MSRRGRRGAGVLGGIGQRLPEHGGATLLEPPDDERAGPGAQEGAGASQGTGEQDRLRGDAEKEKKAFQDWCRKNGYEKAGALLDEDWERMVAFYEFPKEHWKHLRTTNVVESPFATVRLRTNAAKRYQKVANATAVVWKMLLVAESSFRRLDAPERCAEVADGAAYQNGVRVKRPVREEPMRIAA